jgi:hypothetical protein
MNKPTEQEIKEFLDDLRDSDVTNMFGAAPYLEREFGMSRSDARNALMHWMETF